MKTLITSAYRFCKQSPFSISFALALWVVAIANHCIGGASRHLLTHVGFGYNASLADHLRTFFTSVLFAPNTNTLLLSTFSALAVGSLAERRMGHFRVVLAAVFLPVCGSVVAVAFVHLLSMFGLIWDRGLTHGFAVSPMPLLTGLLILLSASMSPVWRYRVRLVTFIVLATLLLYGGLFEDVIRMTTALVGLALGSFTFHRRHRMVRFDSTQRETRMTVGLVMTATALGPLLAVLTTHAVGPLAVLHFFFASPNSSPHTVGAVCADPQLRHACKDLRVEARFGGVGPSLLALLPVILVVAIADGVRRGRSIAWRLAIVIHTLLAVLGCAMTIITLTTPRDSVARLAMVEQHHVGSVIIPTLLPIAVVALLILTRHSFCVKTPKAEIRRLASIVAASTVSLFLIFVGFLFLFANQFTNPPSVTDAFEEFWLRLAPPGYLGVLHPGTLPTTWLATMVVEWVGVVFWSVVFFSALRSFRHVEIEGAIGSRERARAILEQYGHSSMSFLTTWEGNSYWFSPDQLSYVAYRIKSGVALALGDPIGPPELSGKALTGFVDFCNQHQLVPCLYSTTAQTRELLSNRGWFSLDIACETVLELDQLQFVGKQFQDVRTSVNRAKTSGIQARWITFADASDDIRAQITEISNGWCDNNCLPEMTFTLGGVNELEDPAVRCVIAIGENDEVHGITSWLPVYENGVPIAWTLDVMRRRENAFKGVMDFLIATAAVQFQGEGIKFISLSGAPLVRTVEPTPNGSDRLLDTLANVLEPVYRFRSLFAFKAKFKPTYRPMYLCVPDVSLLPAVANAIGHAYLPNLSMGQRVSFASAIASRKQSINKPKRHVLAASQSVSSGRT